MSNDKIIKTLTEKLEIRGEQSRIAAAIGVSKTTVKRWTEDKEITPAHAKLLNLYFFGVLPFGVFRKPEELSSVLKFTGQEWQVIAILATREGYTSPQSWITAQIRCHLRHIAREHERELKAAEDEAPYIIQKKKS